MGFESPQRVAFTKERWNFLNLLLALALDHFAMAQRGRRVWIGPSESGIVQQISACADEINPHPEKFYVFEEQ